MDGLALTGGIVVSLLSLGAGTWKTVRDYRLKRAKESTGTADSSIRAQELSRVVHLSDGSKEIILVGIGSEGNHWTRVAERDIDTFVKTLSVPEREELARSLAEHREPA